MKNIKNIFTLIAFTLIAGFASAQQNSVTAAIAMYSTDSTLVEGYVANTASKIMSVKVTGAWDAMSFQAVITKVSGTVAGTAWLVGSNDGVNFVNVSRASIAISALRPAYTDTLTATNVTTNTKVWTATNQTYIDGSTPACPPYLYYGIKYTGSGTMVAKIKAYAVPRHR